MYEFYYVFYDFDYLKIWKYYLIGENDILFMREEDVDYFVREILVFQEYMNYIKYMINLKLYVYDFVQKLKVYLLIVYSFYCWEEQ